jgi:hypothetical protein
LPIRVLDLANAADRVRHSKIVDLVGDILNLHDRLATAMDPGEKTAIERQIATTDRQIDELIYELYGLTDEEIKIVEGATEP